ncbi:MAG: FAD-dependent oxidoreductase [Pseudonocardia sp.]
MTGPSADPSRSASLAPSTVPETARWVIVGAGITGASVAAHLAHRGAPALVLDAADTPAAGATGASGGMVRCYDPDPVVAQLAAASLTTYADPTAWVGGEAPLWRAGAVTLGGPEHAEAFAAAARTLRAWDCEVANGAEEILGVRTAHGVALVEPAAGWVDPVSVTELFLRQATDFGATVSMGTSVTGLSAADVGVLVATNRGNVRAIEGVVVAAGGWTARPPLRDAIPVGAVRARAIQTAVVGRPTEVGPHATFIDLRSGAYGKPEVDDTSLVGWPLLVWDAEPDTSPDAAHREQTLAAVAGNLPWARHSTVLKVTRSFDAYGECGDVLVAADLPNVWLCRPGNGGGVRVAPELGRVIAQRLSWRRHEPRGAPGVDRPATTSARDVTREPQREGPSMQQCHDMVGIGFGPANIALAIAIEEAQQAGTMPPFDARFLEAQADPEWQGGMLLAGSDIQNHPARDLVTLRNPRSHYTFLNYLHLSGRLIEHLNLPGEFPLRSDYAAYVRWARGHFDRIVDYGQKAATVSVADHAGEQVYEVTTAVGDRYLARSLVVAPGREPYAPAPFDSVSDHRIFHVNDYLYRTEALPAPPDTVVVIGGSQSAVEIMLDLSRRFPRSRIVNYVRSFGLRLKDTSPFSEEGFHPDFTRYYFEASRQSKAVLDAYLRPTNYSSADGDVLGELYLHIYEQRLKGQQRVFVFGNRIVRSVDVRPDAVSLTVAEVHTGAVEQVDADVVVLATGFRDIGPGAHQQRLPQFLDGITEQMAFEDGYPRISVDYLVETPAVPPLFLNGLCETTHGIGDSGSFSLLSLRTAAIQRRLVAITGTVSARPLDRLGERA